MSGRPSIRRLKVWSTKGEETIALCTNTEACQCRPIVLAPRRPRRRPERARDSSVDGVDATSPVWLSRRARTRVSLACKGSVCIGKSKSSSATRPQISWNSRLGLFCPAAASVVLQIAVFTIREVVQSASAVLPGRRVDDDLILEDNLSRQNSIGRIEAGMNEGITTTYRRLRRLRASLKTESTRCQLCYSRSHNSCVGRFSVTMKKR